VASSRPPVVRGLPTWALAGRRAPARGPGAGEVAHSRRGFCARCGRRRAGAAVSASAVCLGGKENAYDLALGCGGTGRDGAVVVVGGAGGTGWTSYIGMGRRGS
jgi:hypothetical protein